MIALHIILSLKPACLYFSYVIYRLIELQAMYYNCSLQVQERSREEHHLLRLTKNSIEHTLVT